MTEAALPLLYRVHALQRMVEREIREEEVEEAVRKGKEIESYADDKPYPSRLLLGWAHERPIHVVAATGEHEIIVITVYEPDPAQWEPGFERRRVP